MIFRPLGIILIIFIFFQSNNFACEDFNNKASSLINRRIINHDDWKIIEESYRACSNSSDVESLFLELKEKRIQTLKNFSKLGIKEEGGILIEEHLAKIQGRSMPPIKPPEKPPVKIPVTPPAISDQEKKEGLRISKKACTKIDEIKNDAVNMDNIRNQDSLGWCYAYVASDLLSYKFNTRLSAISFSSREKSLKDQMGNKALQGGDVRMAIIDAYDRIRGFCLESSLKSSDYEFCKFKDLSEILNFISWDAGSDINNCIEKDLREIFPNISLSTVRASSEAAKITYLEKLIDQHCQKNKLVRNLPRIRTFLKPHATSEQVVNVIDRELEKRNPVAWAFDSNKLTNENGAGEHAVLVVGREFNESTGRCEYLARNSWGKNCPYDLADPQEGRCHKKDGRYTGYFYVSRDHVLSNSVGAYYVE